jgi:hypothetical protein
VHPSSRRRMHVILFVCIWRCSAFGKGTKELFTKYWDRGWWQGLGLCIGNSSHPHCFVLITSCHSVKKMTFVRTILPFYTSCKETDIQGRLECSVDIASSYLSNLHIPANPTSFYASIPDIDIANVYSTMVPPLILCLGVHISHEPP